MQQQFQKRNTAYKFWIKDILQPDKEVEDGKINFKIKNKEVYRVNIIANVILKYETEDKNYLALTLDDGSATIRLKAWKEDTELLKDINIGDILLVIGRVRDYNNEIYILPEIVRVLNDADWMIVRRLELTREFGKPEIEEEITEEKAVEQEKETPKEEAEESVVEEQVVSTQSSRQKIMDIIETSSSEMGAEITEVIEKSGLDDKESEEIINELLKEGEVFSPRPGKVKLIE